MYPSLFTSPLDMYVVLTTNISSGLVTRLHVPRKWEDQISNTKTLDKQGGFGITRITDGYCKA